MLYSINEVVNPYKPSVLFKGHTCRQTVHLDQTQHNAVSDQDILCLLTECSIKF